MKLSAFQSRMADLNDWAQRGCCDSGCRINKRPPGMRTNGGCTCDRREFSEALLQLASDVSGGTRYARWEPEDKKEAKP